MKKVFSMNKHPIWVCLSIFVLMFAIILFEGCTGLSREAEVKKALKDKYGEEFNVYEIDTDGAMSKATVSPVNNPEVLFEANVCKGELRWDSYFQSYVGDLVESKLREDLEQFYPDAYIYVEKANVIMWKENDSGFINKSLEEILVEADWSEGNNDNLGCLVRIYIDKEKGTKHNYEEEYKYFSNTLDYLISEKRMLPLAIQFYKVDSEVLDRVKEYLSKDLDMGYYYEEVLGVEEIEMGIYDYGMSDLGNSTNISACFLKNKPAYIRDYEEYKRRRELFDNESIVSNEQMWTE